MGLIVSVVKVTTDGDENLIELSCGHVVTYEHDEANDSLIGAWTVCGQAHK